MSINQMLKGELIGVNTTAINKVSKKLFKGKIILETKNTFVIDTANGRKTIPKASYAFEFETREGVVRIEGQHLQKRPADRIKSKLRKNG